MKRIETSISWSVLQGYKTMPQTAGVDYRKQDKVNDCCLLHRCPEYASVLCGNHFDCFDTASIGKGAWELGVDPPALRCLAQSG